MSSQSKESVNSRQPSGSPQPPPTSIASPNNGLSVRTRRSEGSHQRGDSLKSFERKLAETDAYLQLLIAQVTTVERKIETAGTDVERAKLSDIRAKTLLLLDKVKLTIVSLQIAKNTVVPEDESRLAPLQVTTKVRNNLTTADNSNNNGSSNSVSDSNNEREDDDNSSADILVEPHKFNARTSSLHRSTADSEYVVGKEVLERECPPGTYSSDDDDDYYDADEDLEADLSLSGSVVAKSTAAKQRSPASTKNSSAPNSPMSNSGNPGEVDYDLLYEEDDGDLDSLEGQGSVISHLLSQVKIGMDLTKVVLPTFILERRSLLEMYADFFAHPDLFVGVADGETPQDRFVRVVRWYVSAFHAGRRTMTAKKPYNPVLGETFRCHWDVPGYKSPTFQENEQNAHKKLSSDGPVPWCTPSNLAFTAEQVSHHPPISAFYSEHIEKKIMFTGYIYTKSAFLGLSIGVHNIGQGSVYLLDKGEEYTINFPSAYGRSILTVPWIELGGNVAINCPQTGFTANIEFLTKPFYGGKKHRITGEIVSPQKTKIASLSGEWNGVMHIKWAQNGSTEPFVDTKSIPIIRKQVQLIAKQEEFESRRIWKEVTLALKMKNVTAATEAKFKIEDHQRKLVKLRAQEGVTWENRRFHSLGNRWNYNSPLTQRLSNRGYQ